MASHSGDFKTSLEKAKEATKRERALSKEREKEKDTASADGTANNTNVDLTFAVLFNLADQFQNNGLYQEALNAYSALVKNKQFTQAGKLRVNMGHIYFQQQQYAQAIKMYRMALDQLSSTKNREPRYACLCIENFSYTNWPMLIIVRMKILRNIGISHLQQGQFKDAASSFESIVDTMPDFRTGNALYSLA